MMGGTIYPMRLCALVLFATACGSDPTLDVSVTHPTGLSVATTTVTVYESSSLHCTDIEFSRLDPAGLEALATSEADLAGGATGGLSGISRLGNKVIVAHGFDTASTLISAGCVEHGEVIGSDMATIATVETAVVSIRPPSDATGEVAVTLTTATGTLIDARPVLWTVSGPAGTTAANPATIVVTGDGEWEPAAPSCTTSGLVKLHPNPPSEVGGYAVQMRAAWAVEQPPPYTALAAAAFGNLDLGITVSTTAKRPCAIRTAGTARHLVCADTSDQAHDYVISVVNGKATAAPQGAGVTAVPNLPVNQHVIAILAIPNASGGSDAYSVSTKGVLVPLFGAPAPVDTSVQCLVDCTDAMLVPACNAIPAKVLIASPGNQTHQIDAHGGNATTFNVDGAIELRLDNAGCVTQLQTSGAPALGQLASVHGGLTSAEIALSGTFLLNCSGGTCAKASDSSLTKGAGVGFTNGAEPRIVATSVDASGVVLVEDVFGPGGNAIERTRLSAAAIPNRMVAGQIDTDTGTDLFWDIAARNGLENFEVAYSRKVGADNLEALSGSSSIDVTDLEIGDLNGDGHDDVVIVSENMNVVGVAIVPMGATLPPPAANSDATCTP